ncbi:MAG: hypothetical protein JWP69_2074 [Flaviaesturariibacter sp.]|nr:hypothetical protein [Flaviaesturariibacter sp.]
MKVQLFSLLALAIGVTACNNDSETTATNTDSATITTTDAASATNTGDYAAMADSFRVNSEAGNYLNPRTGKPIRIKYDVTTRRAVDETSGEPVWRYVDKRNWWVYGADNDNWRQMGTARMEGDRIMYQGDDGSSWLDYEARWKADDERMMSNMDSGTSSDVKVSDDGNKVKDENLKVKTSKDGDIKIKDKKTGEKVKYDADDKKIKTDN